MALIEKLSAVGDAIRRKTGKTELIPLADMPAEIEGIKSGENYAVGICDGSLTDITDEHLGGIKTIRARAFYGSPITSINVSTVEIIQNEVFRETSKLTKAEFPNLRSAGNGFMRNSVITSFFAPCLTAINQSAFESAKKLKTIDFWQLETIGKWGFYGTSALEALIIRTPTMCVLGTSDALQDSSVKNGGTGFVYVPRDLVDSYKTATNWITVADQIRAIEDYPEICRGC